MSNLQTADLLKVTIQKLVHGGQGMATLPDGRKVFVWNALPGEEVGIRLLKSKKEYAEAIAEQIVVPSNERIAAKEPSSYLATSPWQIVEFAAENSFKLQILREAFEREHIELPEGVFVAGQQDFAYRNKMEFGLWGDEDGIHLAHFVRGSHGKTKVQGSALAIPAINTAAADVIAQLNQQKLRAGDIKSIMLRCDQAGNTVAALFVKPKSFPKLQLPASLQGLVVYHSNPKSPASVPTELLYQLGERTLQDRIMGATLSYDVLSFFQVNVPVFTQAVMRIDSRTAGGKKLDFYSGVGSIGIPLGQTDLLVDSDAANIAMAKQNSAGLPIQVVHAPAEKALEHITGEHVLIVDPPRAGLHASVIARIAEQKPPVIAYLSCNPSTQARDARLLCDAGYQISFFEGYNFFPRTPHIESLIVLHLKA